MTALFADIVDSTALAEKIGDEALFSLMQTVVSEMTHAVQDHGGAVEKLTGDGLMALFGAPLAVEDAPLNACRAGLDIIARVMAASGSLAAEHGQRPEIRIGINTGHAVVGSLGTELQQEVTALGHSVNVAARLEGLAEPDSLVIGEATYQLVKDYVDAEFVGEHQVRGKSDAQRIWRVDALETGVRRFDASLRRGLTTLVGRRSELETMLDIQEIVRGGEAQVMNVVGEAGLGKSRLVHEFRQRLPSEDVTWLQGNCSASGREVPFLPFIEVVRSSFGVAENTDGAAIEHRLSRGLEMLGLDPTEGVPYLLNLLGFDVTGIEFSKEHAEIAGIRTRDLLHRLLMEYARVTPVVMHIDDLHWLDSASEALLARMIEDAGDLPLFFLFSYRPEYRPPWAGAKTAKTLELSPLSTDSTAELLRHRLGVEDLPAELTRLVTEKAEGNPLFAEEIVNFLTERGVFDEGEDKDVAPAAMVGLPVSLENLLMARVDRLDDEPRRLLQAASVIGRSFNHEIAGEAAGLDGRAASCVAQLERLELVREDPASGDYLFKHALIQDAVYNSLLGDRLEALHERVADAMERRNSGRLGEIAETLAHHYSRTPRAEKAVRYMAQAGEKSLRVYSLDEAELRLRQVVELIEKVPGCADDAFLIDVLLNLGRVQAFRADMYGLIELLEPHLAKAEALGDPRRLGRFLIEIGAAHACSANAAVGFPLLERGMEIAEEAGDELTVGYAMLGLMLGCTYWEEINGPWRQKITRLTVEGERIGRKFNDNYLTANAIVCMSLLNTIGGRPGEARKHALRLIELSRETNDPRPRSMALWALAVVDFTQLAFEDALESGREGARLALSVFDRNFAEMFVAAGDIMLGRTSEGRPLMSSLNDLFLRRGMFVAVTTSGPLIGVAMIMDGEMAAGFRWIEQCLEKYRSWGHNSAVPLGHLILGELYTRMALGQDRPSLGIMVCNLPFLIRTLPRVTAIARHHLEIALTFFEQADMPSYAAWALYDLALLDQKKGRTAEAAAKLTEARELAQPVEALTLLEMIDAAAKPVS
ncbi:MAG: AAA family ATPase [Alphaproteobacteria bacterium]|nr:AAA family ATPase [Alphaproteobacteria bacterium]